MLRTVLERLEESSVECVLGYSRVVNDIRKPDPVQPAALRLVAYLFD